MTDSSTIFLLNHMNAFKPGDVYYHKATIKKCVVIKMNEDGTVKVRTSDDIERDYYPAELKEPQQSIVKRGGNLY